MSGVSQPLRDKSERPSPRPKTARISPELDEVLRMLKALEDRPDEGRDSDETR